MDDTLGLTVRTIRIGVEATAFAALPGVPLGVALGLGRFRGRRALLAGFNAGLRLPPVALGHGLFLLLWPTSVWGGGLLSGLGWIYTLDATILAQALLALPIVVALTASAVQAVPRELLDQARAFGAGATARAILALREARLAIVAALIAALGTAMASVGAVLIVGSQVDGSTLPAAALNTWTSGGRDSVAAAYGAVSLGLFLAIAAALTTLQHGRRVRWLPAQS